MSETDVNSIGWRTSGYVGLKLKADSGWSDDGNGVNSCGFHALPGGYRGSEGGFSGEDTDASFWSSTGENISNAWTRHLSFQKADMGRYSIPRRCGLSVRCIQD